MADAQKDATRKAVNESYSKAGAALIAAHRDEFNSLRKQILADAGIDWSPPLSREERDEQTVQEILDRNPGLAERLAGKAQIARGI